MARNRITHYFILLLAMVVLNFFLPRMIPGSPVARMAGDTAYDMTAEERARILEFYKLDKPLIEQFVQFLKDTVTLDWGKSYSKKLPIFTLFKNALPWTALLAVTNVAITCVVGTLLGTVSAFLRKRGRDKGLVIFIMTLSAVPAFWIGMVLFSVLGVQLGLLPLYGAYSMWGGYTGIARLYDILRHLAMPLITSVMASLSAFFTTARYGVLGAIERDYVRMARMRGIPEGRVKFFYILRNGFIPVLTVLMTRMGFILGGSLVIERIFSYPGLGLLMADAVTARDYPLMQYTFLITSVMVVLTMALGDALHRRLEPAVAAEVGI